MLRTECIRIQCRLSRSQAQRYAVMARQLPEICQKPTKKGHHSPLFPRRTDAKRCGFTLLRRTIASSIPYFSIEPASEIPVAQAVCTRQRSFGNERIHILLRREGWSIGRNQVHRLYRLEGLMCACALGDASASACRLAAIPKSGRERHS